MEAVARLILVNGVPGAGKSTVARLVVDRLPRALLLDIDAVRTMLGQWEDDPGSRLIARDLAVVLTGAHLATGHDVVIPQHLGRPAFVEGLNAIARSSGATLVECVLVVNPQVAVERFRARRAHLDEAGVRHPELDIADEVVEAEVHDAATRLTDVLARRPATHRIDGHGEPRAAAVAILALLADPPPS